MRRELYDFAQMQPSSSEEVIYYLAKAKLILDEYIVGMRLLEKEPHASLRCFEQIHEHIENYKKHYPKPAENEDPWLEDEVDQDEEDDE